MNGLTALADPTRQQIVKMLAKGALSSGDIARRFEMTPPAVSQHLKTLREAKLVKVRAEAQKRFYELDPEGVGEVADWVAKNIRKTEAEKSAYRDYIFNRGRDDDAARERLKMRKAESGLADRDEIQTFVDYIDADEKRI